MRKPILLALFITLSTFGFSQKKLPIIKANINQARIYEEGNSVSGWNISPTTTLDIFTSNKLTSAKTVKFKTDIDSIIFKLKPGEKKDFIVLLKGKDSCLTRIETPEMKNFSKVKPEIHDTIPLVINAQNTMYVPVVLNHTDTLNLNFDTGTTELVLTNETLKNKLKSKPQLYNTKVELKIGKRTYHTKVYDTERTGHDTDGRFGWDLFDGMIVELNYDKNIMVVHSKMPKEVRKDKAYTPLDIKYSNQLFLVESNIAQSGTVNKDWFLFDTGYQRTVMLDNDLLQQNNFPTEKMSIIKKVMMHGASGNEVPVITSNLAILQIGKYQLNNVPAQLLTTNKPIKNVKLHLLGNEVLKRFNSIIDFQEHKVYMKPNHFYSSGYMEETKSSKPDN
jgi:hypothetical protein